MKCVLQHMVKGVCRYELVGSKNNCYFIQGLETWYESRNIIEKTFNLGFKNIVIAQYTDRKKIEV